MTYKAIEVCRICGNQNLKTVVELGDQELTGVFPSDVDQKITCGPLVLKKCNEEADSQACGLLQLAHSYSLDEMYGENYGYRSGLNKSMVTHLNASVRKIMDRVKINKDDLIVDIGSNDSTLLQAYPEDCTNLVGIDPTGVKFKKYYPERVKLIPTFFSKNAIQKELGDKKAKVITSFSMFYDLEAPLNFMKEVASLLAHDGVWVFEQSYMPLMLERNSYDTACHEHLEYYGLRQVKWMADKVGLKILDVDFNNINGGSFVVYACKEESGYVCEDDKINSILDRELKKNLQTLAPYEDFAKRVKSLKNELREFLMTAKREGKVVAGYGASTKGNVTLQYCDITTELLPYIVEINEDKFGKYTPQTHIPIISEEEANKEQIDYKLILPWHFRDTFLNKEKEFLRGGGKLVFPFPTLEIIG